MAYPVSAVRGFAAGSLLSGSFALLACSSFLLFSSAFLTSSAINASIFLFRSFAIFCCFFRSACNVFSFFFKSEYTEFSFRWSEINFCCSALFCDLISTCVFLCWASCSVLFAISSFVFSIFRICSFLYSEYSCM